MGSIQTHFMVKIGGITARVNRTHRFVVESPSFGLRYLLLDRSALFLQEGAQYRAMAVVLILAVAPNGEVRLAR